jgi:hypothetical protein
MSQTTNPNLARSPELNHALTRLKSGAGTPDELKRDFQTVRDAIAALETMATASALETLGDYGNVLRGFARGYQNLRTMIDDAGPNAVAEPPREDFPA